MKTIYALAYGIGGRCIGAQAYGDDFSGFHPTLRYLTFRFQSRAAALRFAGVARKQIGTVSFHGNATVKVLTNPATRGEVSR